MALVKLPTAMLIVGLLLPASLTGAATPKDLIGSWTIGGLAASDGSCLEADSGYYPVTVSSKKLEATSSTCELIKVTPGGDLPGSYRAIMSCRVLGGKPFKKAEGWLLVTEDGKKSWLRMSEGSTHTSWVPCKRK